MYIFFSKEIFHQRGLRRVPSLEDGDQVIDNIDDIVSYLEVTVLVGIYCTLKDEFHQFDLQNKFPDNRLLYDNPKADSAIKNVFSRFCFYIKQISKDSTHLENELQVLNNFLGQRGSIFLCGNNLTHLDCEFLPKLQHIRVASAALKNFFIPISLTHIWAYLFAAYNSDVFVQTCPSDQEIVLHWLDRPQLGQMAYDEHKKLIQEPPKHSFDVPAVAALVNLE
jgi:glutathione S-transferase